MGKRVVLFFSMGGVIFLLLALASLTDGETALSPWQRGAAALAMGWWIARCHPMAGTRLVIHAALTALLWVSVLLVTGPLPSIPNGIVGMAALIIALALARQLKGYN